MIAGTITIGGKPVRVLAEWGAVGEVAGAAMLGLEGPEGRAAVKRFMRAVIDRRDHRRFWRGIKDDADLTAHLATAIGVILHAAASSPDPSMRQWAGDFHAAIERFQAGDQRAFADLAIANGWKP